MVLGKQPADGRSLYRWLARYFTAKGRRGRGAAADFDLEWNSWNPDHCHVLLFRIALFNPLLLHDLREALRSCGKRCTVGVEFEFDVGAPTAGGQAAIDVPGRIRNTLDFVCFGRPGAGAAKGGRATRRSWRDPMTSDDFAALRGDRPRGPKDIEEWIALYRSLKAILEARGTNDANGTGDFWLLDDYVYLRRHVLTVDNFHLLTPDLVRAIQGTLRGRFRRWKVYISTSVVLAARRRQAGGIIGYPTKPQRYRKAAKPSG